MSSTSTALSASPCYGSSATIPTVSVHEREELQREMLRDSVLPPPLRTAPGMHEQHAGISGERVSASRSRSSLERARHPSSPTPGRHYQYQLGAADALEELELLRALRESTADELARQRAAGSHSTSSAALTQGHVPSATLLPRPQFGTPPHRASVDEAGDDSESDDLEAAIKLSLLLLEEAIVPGERTEGHPGGVDG
jgi:hypothetical protein